MKELSRCFVNLSLLMVLGFATGSQAFAETNGNEQAELSEINQLLEQGSQKEALDKVNVFLAKDPKHAEALFTKGVILVELNRREEAVKIFTDITVKYPHLPEPYNNLAVLYSEMGQYDKSRIALESAIKTHPSYATAHENLGDIYARLASEAYGKALKIDNSNVRTQNKLALITDFFEGKRTVSKNGAKSKTGTKPIKPAPIVTLPQSVPVVAAPAPLSIETVKPLPPVAKSAVAVKTPPPVVKPQIQAEPKMETVTSAPVEDASSAIVAAVQSWAKAWASQNVSSYLAHYATGFTPENGLSYATWERQRRERVSRPSKISLKVFSPEVNMLNENEAKVVFKQTYKTTSSPSTINKTLWLIKENGHWLIKREKVGRG